MRLSLSQRAVLGAANSSFLRAELPPTCCPLPKNPKTQTGTRWAASAPLAHSSLPLALHSGQGQNPVRAFVGTRSYCWVWGDDTARWLMDGDGDDAPRSSFPSLNHTRGLPHFWSQALVPREHPWHHMRWEQTRFNLCLHSSSPPTASTDGHRNEFHILDFGCSREHAGLCP